MDSASTKKGLLPACWRDRETRASHCGKRCCIKDRLQLLFLVPPWNYFLKCCCLLSLQLWNRIFRPWTGTHTSFAQSEHLLYSQMHKGGPHTNLHDKSQFHKCIQFILFILYSDSLWLMTAILTTGNNSTKVVLLPGLSPDPWLS